MNDFIRWAALKPVLALAVAGQLGASIASARNLPPPKPFGPVPSPRQMKWHEIELYSMLNFSTITYYGKEWGYGDEDAARFNPTNFDAEQIVRAAKAAGIKGMMECSVNVYNSANVPNVATVFSKT